MKTVVFMERSLFGSVVRQNSGNGYFSAKDLELAGNKFRINNDMPLFDRNEWLRNKGTKEFIAEIEEKKKVKAVITNRGRGAQMWFHPLLFIDMALAISPRLKIEAYDWLWDSLLANRNDSGDSYKKMCGALYLRHSNKRDFSKYIMRVATAIQKKCGVTDWQKANEEQLRLRDKLHENIALLSDILTDNDQAVRMGLKKTNND